jgi:hypothetical protein
MNDFRIIAIRTGKRLEIFPNKKKTEINLNPLKVLQPNTIYRFYTQYEFPENNFSKIIYIPDRDFELYKLKTANNNISVNINAIVGSNGSGKSTLIELLYWANYNIGSKLGLLKDDNGKKYQPFDFLNLEILFSIDKFTLFRLNFCDGEIRKTEIKLKNTKFTSNGSEKLISIIEDLSDFFYTIVVNYSHYALNSKEIGDWINPLFHKNDGYQTPIVLNPMREDGIIDINKERHLLSRRLQANILEVVKKGHEKKSLRNIVNGKIAIELLLTYNPNPLANLEESKPETKEIVNAIRKHFAFNISTQRLNNDMFTLVTLNYVIEKLKKISNTYLPYRKFRNGQSIKYINALIKRVKDSDSHIIFKVKGAILFLKYFNKIFDGVEFSLNKSFMLNIEKQSKIIEEISKLEPFWVNTFMMAPPSFFHIEIIPQDGTKFDNLSSGEKQRIHSISSIAYHLINLNSVEQLKEDKKNLDEQYVRYNYINIILDELELYYHPDWQRSYIADLLDYIGKISPKSLKYIKGLNITFLTHSPFILSDIPSTNILFLEVKEDGLSHPQNNLLKTFGANIHDLLKSGFFMQGFIGEFAKERIEEFLDWVENKSKPIKEQLTFYKKFIDVIGDPIIKSRLQDLYYKKIGKPSYEELLSELKQLKKDNQ